jgi:hypothetical protein
MAGMATAPAAKPAPAFFKNERLSINSLLLSLTADKPLIIVTEKPPKLLDEWGKQYKAGKLDNTLPKSSKMALRHGGIIVVAHRWYPSSKTCSGCGHRLEV